MTNRTLDAFTHYLRRLVVGPVAEDTDDRQLLARFVAQHDATAFAVLVERYGPLVFGLCRRNLRDEHDADDAFQATFLLLVRSAAKVRDPDRLSSWLHGVAYKVCAKARRATKSRVAREKTTAAGQGTAGRSSRGIVGGHR